ncbi:MAG TPA: hypothetical protein GXX61_01325 [Bacteroidales bacterium]|nr:hypothetical protein [Bacteroidales bacterium]
MPVIRLTDGARNLLEHYRWPGNVRQLKNVAEQLSVLEQNRTVTAETLQRYLPADSPLHLPVVYDGAKGAGDDFISERDILYKILFQLRSEMDQLKKKMESIENKDFIPSAPASAMLTRAANDSHGEEEITEGEILPMDTVEEMQDLSLNSLEKELITKVLQKNKGHRKATAKELGIAERTLYRKIKEYEIE